MGPTDFSYLSDVFSNWYDEKFEYYGELLIEPESDDYLEYYLSTKEEELKAYGFTKKAFYKNFLLPYLKLCEDKRLNSNLLELIADIQTKVIGHRKDVLLNGEAPVAFSIFPSSINYLDALDWTVSNVNGLQLKGFEFEEGRYEFDVLVPDKQCRNCGRLDFDPKGKQFTEKHYYCHSNNCKNTTESNPEKHKNCCYGEWALNKKTFKQKLKRLSGYAHGIKSLFTEFCDKQLEANLQLTNRIRIKSNEH